jgi:hypothetical protein
LMKGKREIRFSIIITTLKPNLSYFKGDYTIGYKRNFGGNKEALCLLIFFAQKKRYSIHLANIYNLFYIFFLPIN